MKKIISFFALISLFGPFSVLADETSHCDNVIFTAVEKDQKNHLFICKTGDDIQLSYGLPYSKNKELEFKTNIKNVSWGEEINVSNTSKYRIIKLINENKTYGVYTYMEIINKEYHSGLIFFNALGRQEIELDPISVRSNIGPKLTELGIEITNDF